MNLSQTLARRWAAACLAVFTMTAAPARGATAPAFDFLEAAVDSAELIVLGRLDPKGSLSVQEVLDGDAVKDPIRVGEGASIAGGLQRLTKVEGAVEVVAFLKKPAQGHAVAPQGIMGFAALKGDAVFTPDDTPLGQMFHEPRVHCTRETLLVGIRAELLRKRERTRLVALPRGPERTSAMIAFLRESVAAEKATPPYPLMASVHLRAFALALKNPTPDETSALVAALREELAPLEKVEVVKLSRLIPLGPEGFAAVAPLTARAVPAVVRRAAIDAVAQMDQTRAVEVLIPLLSLDEPELIAVLGGFGSPSYPSSDHWLDLRAVDALERLALEMRKQHAMGGRNVLGNEGRSLLYQLGHYYHPRLVATLVEWALAEDHVTSGQAFSELRSVVGLNDMRALKAWWPGARPLLEPVYVLADASGLEQWLQAWTKGDEATRACLMRLWNFEAQIDWEGVLKVAEGSEPARRVLAELWRSGRLPTEGKKAIVERFLSVKLVEKFTRPGHPDIREIAVELNSTFPFPAGAWVHCACNIIIGDREPVLKDGDSASSFSLQDLKKVTSASMGGGSYPGRPTARALYELREEVPSGQPEGWKVRWTVEPLVLRDIRKK